MKTTKSLLSLLAAACLAASLTACPKGKPKTPPPAPPPSVVTPEMLDEDACGYSRETNTRRIWKTHATYHQGVNPDDGMMCVAYAGLTWLQAEPKAITLPFTLNELYAEAQRFDGLRDGTAVGTYPAAMFEALKRRGLVRDYYRFTERGKVAEWVYHVGPVVVGSDWRAGMENGDGGWMDGAGFGYLYLHAYVLTGVDFDLVAPDGSRGAFYVTHVLGDGYRCSNHAWLPFTSLDSLMIERHTQVVGALR